MATGVSVAVDKPAKPANVYPVQNNSFIAGATTYTVNVLGRLCERRRAVRPDGGRTFHRAASRRCPTSPTGCVDKNGNGKAVKGYVISEDDHFSADGKAVYTVNAVNVAKATNQARSRARPVRRWTTTGRRSATR